MYISVLDIVDEHDHIGIFKNDAHLKTFKY